MIMIFIIPGNQAAVETSSWTQPHSESFPYFSCILSFQVSFPNHDELTIFLIFHRGLRCPCQTSKVPNYLRLLFHQERHTFSPFPTLPSSRRPEPILSDNHPDLLGCSAALGRRGITSSAGGGIAGGKGQTCTLHLLCY